MDVPDMSDMPRRVPVPTLPEQAPALLPDRDGYVERGGVRVHWEVYGDPHRPTVLLLPTWSIVTSRVWKGQIPYLSRHFRVVCFDGRGNGRSDRPVGAAAYRNEEYAADARAVLDATDTRSAVVVGFSCGASWALHLAADHPARVRGVVSISASCGFPVSQPEREEFVWDARLDTTRGWAKYNRHHWLTGGYDDFVEFFFARMFSEPHSTKQVEDGIGWAHQTTPQVLADTTAARLGCDGVACTSVEEVARRVRAPVLALHGTEDRVRPAAISERLVELTGGELVLLEGSGHGPIARDPVRVNRVIRDFVERVAPDARASYPRWTHAAARQRRALYLSSPIGLGHARRDLAVVDELRKRHPDLAVDWLAQHPVSLVLEAEGERVHPASAALLSESGHIEDECTEHDLHAFRAIRRMDEILVNNFHVFHDLVEAEHYDLVVGDEAWEVDHFLHENPELKRFSFAWLTDFVGWLPMPDGGPDEAALTADHNAEMIEHRARFRRVRDASIFVGEPDDVVPDSFGPGLPSIRTWTEANFDFAGYVTGFDPATVADREELRKHLGYHPDERLCVVAVGGSGVGVHLLRRVLDAVPLVRRAAPDLRFLVVAGPRIDPRSLPRRRGANVRGHVPHLHLHLAAADLAVVQAGLTTCMELVAGRRPFLHVPLRHHFEQNFHVRHRLERYGAGRMVAYEDATDPDALAAEILAGLTMPTDYLPVESDGAARAADLLAGLL